MRGVSHIRPENRTIGRRITNDKHVSSARTAVRELPAIRIQRAERRAVAIQTICQTPVVDELEAGGDEETDFLREGAGQELLLQGVIWVWRFDGEGEGC